MKKPPKRLPIKLAKDIARQKKQKQVVILTWDGKTSHVITYGTSLEHCDAAAEAGNKLKRVLGWPESLCNAEPSRIKKLKDRILELERLANPKWFLSKRKYKI